MVHGSLPYFWADMSTYPGNSGGPVIANDRLIGIVSHQAQTPIEGQGVEGVFYTNPIRANSEHKIHPRID